MSTNASEMDVGSVLELAQEYHKERGLENAMGLEMPEEKNALNETEEPRNLTEKEASEAVEKENVHALAEEPRKLEKSLKSRIEETQSKITILQELKLQLDEIYEDGAWIGENYKENLKLEPILTQLKNKLMVFQRWVPEPDSTYTWGKAKTCYWEKWESTPAMEFKNGKDCGYERPVTGEKDLEQCKKECQDSSWSSCGGIDWKAGSCYLVAFSEYQEKHKNHMTSKCLKKSTYTAYRRLKTDWCK
jgi:hypothetical protein